MSISREVKIGLTGIIALVVLYLIITFLQGANLFSTQDTYYINFRNAKALAKSSPVYADGYNVGININEAAGQSVFHCHMHLIPRYKGDVPNPKGGVRGVIPSKQKY